MSDCNTLLAPFLPHAANKVHLVLGGEGEFVPMPRIEQVDELDPDNGAGLLSYPVITGDYSGTPRWESRPVTVGATVEKPTPVFTKLDPSVVDEELARVAAEWHSEAGCWAHACGERCRDVPAALRGEAEAHPDDQPLRGVGVRRGGQPDPADGAGRAEAAGVQGAGHLLLRRGKSRPVFGFKARKKLDLNAGYDITDEGGAQIGFFRKDFGASLLRSTFHIEGPGYAGTGRERNQVVGLLRRFTELDFIPIHFDFVDAEGNALFSVERKMSIGDRYRVTVPDERVDFRVAAAVAVGLDALMSR